MFLPLMSLAIAALFFVLTPGVFVTLPSGKGKLVVAATHAALFGLIFHLSHKTLMNLAQQYELFEDLKLPCTLPGKVAPKKGTCCIGSPNESRMC